MELNQLRYFSKAAELGSFTRAAQACGVSQPSLSQQIQKLEGELGQPLFHRDARAVRPTDAGRLLKDRVDQALRLLDDAKAHLLDDANTGRLTIAAIPTIAPYLLPRLLKDFSGECPQARIDVIEDVTAGILRRCHQGEIDLAVVALPIETEGLHVRPLFQDELQLVVPAEHRLADQRRVTLDDLTDEPFVLLGEAHCLTGNALSFCHQHAFQPIKTSQVSQLATILELVALGQGISLIPAMAQAADRASSRTYRSLSGKKPQRTIALIWNRHRFQGQLFKRFVQFMEGRYTSEAFDG